MRFQRLILTGVLCLALVNAASGAQLFVYPKNGQDAERQDKDEHDCYRWAKSNSGVDPNSQPQQPDRRRRAAGALGGAGRGAALGAAMGAIDGDAGKGAAMGAVGGGVMGRRRGMMNQQMEQDMTLNTYHRAFAACMEGRGYTVK